MYTKCVIAFLNLFIVVRAFTAEGCAPCDLRTCAEETAFACDGGRTLARDPCGCCDQCTRLQWEPCGGQDWTLGYCALGLTCAAMNQTGAVTIPDIGVCKVLPEHPEAGLEDLRCPLLTGCDRAGAQCVCDSRHSCLGSFSYPDRESCMRSSQTEGRRHSGPPRDRPQEKFVGRPETPCRWAGCNLTARGCVCETHSCHRTFAYADLRQCRQAAEELRCAAVTCPSVPVPSCPPGSVLTKSYTPPAGCCPSVPARCTCDPASCPEPRCPSGLHPVLQRNASGAPGDCCPLLDCQKGSPKCVHNGKEFSESEVYRMDHCWLCQCRGGISFCSKAECAELDCDNFYVPDGECCPVCLDVVLLSSDGAEASCWMSNALRAHEEQWREDDCTFCQCVDGDPRCTAMACRQSCQNPVKIPGECCPFCKEPSYETLSPVLCPRLENCTLSGTDCPLGFQQDHDGCLLCACLNNDSCPDLGARCSLQCPMGYEKDAAGCDACECAAPTPKCRPLTCSKSCPHGYVRNKQGCEMCRCVKCPPFTCDKHCHHGYRHNKKGCSVCMCKESASVPSTSPPAPAPSHCLTSDGRGYEQGESWHDGCRDCYCHSTQREMCVLISCPVPSCPHPVVRPQQCCPTCEADESGSGQPEGGDLVVCRALGGELHVEGDTWNLDECTRCTCRKARVLCDTEICPPAVCPAPVRNRDTCCYVCPENQPGPLLPVDRAQQDYCVTGEGEVLLSGDTWRTDACTSCLCANGTVQCFSQRCPPAVCRVPVLRKGQCCPHCLDTSTTSAPVTVTTSRATFRTSPRTTTTTRTTSTSTTSTRTPTRDSPVWVTTAAGPPVVIIPATDDSRLGEDYPSQTEMALIYQSAAWILAGLLLAIVIFLVVALLVNRKKKWVQMSCYSAPKKTVILKKHLNKNSVVYMEPTKESKFQGGLVSFSPETGLHGGAGERMILPRAKLSTGSGRGPR